MNELQIFNNADFGEIRMTEVDGKPYAVAVDVARALGYTNAPKAIGDHCRWVTKRYVPHPQSPDKKIEVNVIPEGDLYRLIVNSRLPAAEKFERWVFDEVLPTIRETSKYEVPKPEPKQPKLGEYNSAARIIRQTLKEAGTAPEFIAVAVKGIYETAGINLSLNGVTLPKHFYEVTEIADRLGVISKSGKPHGQAISAIIAQIDVSSDETIVVPFHSLTSGHAGTHTQYSQSVVNRIEQWIRRHDYPSPMFLLGKTFKVTYTKRN